MIFSPDDYTKSSGYYDNTWKTLDDTLYRLCRENPDHSKMSSVCAKLWVIGRTYATGIERKVATTGAQGSSMSQVASHFFSHSAEVDAWFKELSGISEPLTPARLQIIASIHGRIVRLLCPITRRNQSTRSFVSKYMHFHNAAVPIYDSVATGALPQLVRWTDDLSVFTVPPDADKDYSWYLMRFFALYEQVRQAGLRATVRHLDHYLLTLADSRYTAVAPPPVMSPSPTSDALPSLPVPPGTASMPF